MATRGIDIRQTADRIVFRASLKDSLGAKITTGTAELRLYRLEDDGTLDVYDWTTNDFVATGSGTPDDETTLTHQNRRDSSGADVATGIWTKVLSTLTNFVAGQVYLAQVTHADAAPESHEREFQFGGRAGDGDVNLTLVDGSSAAVVAMKALFASAELVTVDDATLSPTATDFETTQTVNQDEYTDQVLFCISGANAGMTVKITTYAYTGNNKVKLTVDTLRTAPADGDQFIKMGLIL